PIAVGLLLIVGRDREREGFGMFERGTTVEANAGNAGNGEFDHYYVSRLAGRVVARCTNDGAHFAVGQGLGVEAGGSLGVLIVPDANRILCHRESFRLPECLWPIVPELLLDAPTAIRQAVQSSADSHSGPSPRIRTSHRASFPVLLIPSPRARH